MFFEPIVNAFLRLSRKVHTLDYLGQARWLIIAVNGDGRRYIFMPEILTYGFKFLSASG